MFHNKKPLLVILGPTATGKTDLALHLAKKFNGELISSDSRQVYKWLNLGTGKLPNGEVNVVKRNGYWEINGITVWLYDVADPKKQYNVALFVQDANRAIEKIFKRGKLPIIVGGTGLYLKALLEGLSNLSMPIDKKLRKKLERLTKIELQEKLQEISLKRWEELNPSDRQNPRRLIRAIELSGIQKTKLIKPNYQTLKIGLTATREVLYEKVDKRVMSRINQGMLDEAKKLHKKGVSLNRMKQLGLEYGVLADYLEGDIKNTGAMIKIMQNKIHGYVRAQLTWFKKEKDIHWFDITEKNLLAKVEKVTSKWYHQT